MDDGGPGNFSPMLLEHPSEFDESFIIHVRIPTNKRPKYGAIRSPSLKSLFAINPRPVFCLFVGWVTSGNCQIKKRIIIKKKLQQTFQSTECCRRWNVIPFLPVYFFYLHLQACSPQFPNHTPSFELQVGLIYCCYPPKHLYKAGQIHIVILFWWTVVCFSLMYWKWTSFLIRQSSMAGGLETTHTTIFSNPQSTVELCKCFEVWAWRTVKVIKVRLFFNTKNICQQQQVHIIMKNCVVGLNKIIVWWLQSSCIMTFKVW